MELDRMLEKCVQGQWRIDQLDWSVKPRPMAKSEEIKIVQYFTDMAAIERLAGALFAEQRKLVDDPSVKKIFATFVADEERHARAAERLAEHYDVHRYRKYRISPELERFQPYFLAALKHLSPEMANVYITAGELMLDVALLRSLNDYVDDDMSNQAMDLINRDESRHIAMDYYMMDYYASPAYDQWMSQQPKKSAREIAQATWAFANLLYHARPFLIAVFLKPMELLDPDGRRIKEAFKRMQLLSTKPHLLERPFPKFLYGMREAYKHPVLGKYFGSILSRVGGAPGEFMVDLYSEEEQRRAEAMTLEEMAQDAINAKFVH